MVSLLSKIKVGSVGFVLGYCKGYLTLFFVEKGIRKKVRSGCRPSADGPPERVLADS